MLEGHAVYAEYADAVARGDPAWPEPETLVDIAGYRIYGHEEGVLDKAAAVWAWSPEGQATIERAGGLPMKSRLVEPGEPEGAFRVRRI